MDTNTPQDSKDVKGAAVPTETVGSSRREFLGQSGRVAAGVGVAALLGNLGQYALSYAAGGPPIKIGILHSLSGTMAISEVSLRDVVLMAVEEINKAGGVLGRQIEAKVVDPASNWDLFAEKAKQLLLEDKVSVVFGCWTSVSRKSVLPVFEKNNGLLFYPVQYEGEECSRNVFYTGAAVNQQGAPAVEYLM
ncbi:MAG TPA: transporter substrate-binding protein, partial [Nitrospira sp.]